VDLWFQMVDWLDCNAAKVNEVVGEREEREGVKGKKEVKRAHSHREWTSRFHRRPRKH
jgi:hypothetical protein